jgi:gluconolactonase
MVYGVAVLASIPVCADPYAVSVELDRPTGSIEILDDAALDLIDPSATILIRAEGYQWSEGPLWVKDGGYLLFSDVPNNVIHRYDPGIGARLYLENSGATGLQPSDSSQGSNGLILDPGGRLVLLQHGDRRVAVMDAPLSTPEANYRTLIGAFHEMRLNSPNDGIFRSDGSLFFTDPPYGLANGLDDEGKELPFQGIYRLSPDGKLYLLDGLVTFPNGIGLSTDENILYVSVSDSENPEWLAYDVSSEGDLSGKRVFHDASNTVGDENEPGLPDGMVVHSSGVIFATGPGGVWLFSREGNLLAKIRTGKATSNCALSTDEKTLFITAHDMLMTVQLR